MVAARVRADSWATPLSPEQQWALFDYHYEVAKGKWELSAAWAKNEFKLPKLPARSGFYAWLKEMNDLESVRRQEIRNLADERIAAAAKDIDVNDPALHRALLAEAMNRAIVEKNPDAADSFLRMATSLVNSSLHAKSLDLKARDLDRKDEELKLASKRLEILEAREAASKNIVADKLLSPEDKLAELDKLFGK